MFRNVNKSKKIFHQRSSFNIVTIYLSGYSASIAHKLNKLKITPNFVTVSRVILFVIPAGILLAMGGYLNNVIAGLLIFMNYFFDLVDGDLARNYNKKTSLGKFLDENLDLVTIITIYTGIAFFMINTNHSLKFFGLFILAIFPLGVKLVSLTNNKFSIHINSGNLILNNSGMSWSENRLSFLFKEILYPSTTISLIFFTFRYYLLVGILFNITPIALTIYFFVMLFGIILLIVLIWIYESNGRLSNELLITKLLKKIDNDRGKTK